MARSTGLKKDLRLSIEDTYSNYNLLNIKSFLGLNGDSFDRYLIRMLEMGESLKVSNELVSNLLKFEKFNNKKLGNFLIEKKIKKNNYSSMEDLISHFIN
jgi:NADH-quinone oxidoreductase subunit D